MKIVEDNVEIIRSNDFEEADIKIKTTAKAFAVLSGIYSNIHKAILREYGTNCLDSLITRGNKDEPFSVHLPTRIENYLSFKDSGIGLTYQEIKDTFFTYFESTKDKDNKFVGFAGLGAKSALAYTDSINVTGIKDGIKVDTTIYLNEDRIPKIVKINETYTDEDNGVEVIIPTKEGDINLFRNLAQEVFKWFEVKPIFNISLNVEERPYSEKGWISNQQSYNSKTLAVMGPICYPVDLKRIEREHASNLGLTMFFDMGDLNITPSREELNYTNGTIKNLQSKIDSAFSEYTKDIQAQIDAQDCLFAASALGYKIVPHWMGISNIKWRGIALRDHHWNIDSNKYEVCRYESGSLTRKIYNLSRYNRPTIILADMKNGNYVSARRYSLKENKTVYLFFLEDKVTKQDIITDFGLTEADILSATALYTRPEKVKGEKYEFFKYKNWGYGKSYHWEGASPDLESDELYYVDMERFDFKIGNESYGPELLRDILEELNKYGFLVDKTVYGLRKCVNKFENWTNVIDIAREKLEKKYIELEFPRKCLLSEFYSQHRHSEYAKLGGLTLDKDFELVSQLLKEGEVAHSNRKEISKFHTIKKILKLNIPEPQENYNEIIERLKKKYNLLEHASFYGTGPCKAAAEYVNLKYQESIRFIGSHTEF